MWRIHHQETTASTNLDARRGTPGDVFWADYQTAGRGRLDHKWLAPREANLMFSALCTIADRPLEEVVTFPLVVGLAVRRAFTRLCPAVPFFIKWPNDVLAANGQKIVGVLCERLNDAIIAGVGINVNQTSFPPELAHRATSLALLLGHPLDREEVLNVVLDELSTCHAKWRLQGFAALQPQFAMCDFLAGKHVSVRQTDSDPQPIRGLCTGVASDGTLCVGGHTIYAGEAHIESITEPGA